MKQVFSEALKCDILSSMWLTEILISGNELTYEGDTETMMPLILGGFQRLEDSGFMDFGDYGVYHPAWF